MSKQTQNAAVWAHWPPFSLVAPPDPRPPVSDKLKPFRVLDALYVHDADQDQTWPLSVVFLNFKVLINDWWLKEQQGKLGDFGLTHKEMLERTAKFKRVAEFWPYAPPVKALILSATEAVEKTIHNVETKHGPAGSPRRIREGTLSSKLWGLNRLRVAVNRTRRLTWPPFDWFEVLASALKRLPDDMPPAGDLDKTIRIRMERFGRRERPRGEEAMMADVLANVLHYGRITPNGSVIPTPDP